MRSGQVQCIGSSYDLFPDASIQRIAALTSPWQTPFSVCRVVELLAGLRLEPAFLPIRMPMSRTSMTTCRLLRDVRLGTPAGSHRLFEFKLQGGH